MEGTTKASERQPLPEVKAAGELLSELCRTKSWAERARLIEQAPIEVVDKLSLAIALRTQILRRIDQMADAIRPQSQDPWASGKSDDEPPF